MKKHDLQLRSGKFRTIKIKYSPPPPTPTGRKYIKMVPGNQGAS